MSDFGIEKIEADVIAATPVRQWEDCLKLTV